MSNDYIPTRDADFDPWFKNFTQYVSGKASGSGPEWTHIPPAETAKLTAAYGLKGGAKDNTVTETTVT